MAADGEPLPELQPKPLLVERLHQLAHRAPLGVLDEIALHIGLCLVAGEIVSTDSIGRHLAAGQTTVCFGVNLSRSVAVTRTAGIVMLGWTAPAGISRARL